ncbi:DUF3558 domain-containing protein [Allosaccharopolyspora coralli]|uniref:DUF3558 domain-containing protein n=1 Tax=Allosaccharopolyspora coralli TaxID=2665642 RepID=UPI001651CCE4|nr:DUF3558 domain-containing protein [Allosaccharopolyspora coralli]
MGAVTRSRPESVMFGAGRAVGVVGLSLAVTACGGGAAEQVVSEPAPRPPPGSGPATSTTPWDPGPLLENPCRALTAEQLLDLGIASGTGERQPDAPDGPTCRWSDRFTGPTDSSTDVTFPEPGEPSPETGGQERELRPVGGRLTVATIRTADVPDAASACDVSVDVDGDDAVLVRVVAGGSSPFGADVCARAVTVAENVLATAESDM